MTRALVFCVVLAGCSSSESAARAELQVTLGTAAPATIAADITTRTMGSRFFMEATDGLHVTVIVSLATPVTARQVDVASDTEVASIWGQLDAQTPLLTRAGTLAIASSGEKQFDFQFTNVSKPMDAMGAAVLITGTITGVSVP